jgi:hypothetical protein
MPKLIGETIVLGELPVKFPDIAPVCKSEPQLKSNRTVPSERAACIFSPKTRAVRRGPQAATFGPQSGVMMTNANVETVRDVAVQNVTGRMLALRTKVERSRSTPRRTLPS